MKFYELSDVTAALFQEIVSFGILFNLAFLCTQLFGQRGERLVKRTKMRLTREGGGRRKNSEVNLATPLISRLGSLSLLAFFAFVPLP